MKFKHFYKSTYPVEEIVESYEKELFYDGSIKRFPKDEFNVAVADMFFYPAKVAHLELVGDEWLLYTWMPENYTSVPLYYVKGASKEQQDFINSCWFIKEKSSPHLSIRFD